MSANGGNTGIPSAAVGLAIFAVLIVLAIWLL
jgi:hypothetical protein